MRLYVVNLVGVLMLAGCAAKGEVVPINLIPVVQRAAQKPDAFVVVVPFEDSRPAQGRLGTRAHFWGGQSYFEIPGGKAGDAVAKAVADYLKAKGWNVQLASSSEAVSGADKPDVILSGKVLTLSVDAQSKFLKTEMVAKTKIAVQGKNMADDSVVRVTLNGAGSQSVIFFDAADAERLLNDVLVESLDKLAGEAKFEERLLRLK